MSKKLEVIREILWIFKKNGYYIKKKWIRNI